jgi:hypothetical protein
MFYNNRQTHNVSGESEDDLLCLSTLHYILWNFFWDNSPYAIQLFRIQKKLIRIMMGLKKKDSCKNSFKDMKILTLWCQYIYSLMQYVVNNEDLITRNNEVHNKVPCRILTYFSQVSLKRAYYSGINIYNHLPKKLNSYPVPKNLMGLP